MCELKNLQASGLTTLGHALRAAFDLLNLNRLVSGIDNYGQVCNTLSCMSSSTVWFNTPTRGCFHSVLYVVYLINVHSVSVGGII